MAKSTWTQFRDTVMELFGVKLRPTSLAKVKSNTIFIDATDYLVHVKDNAGTEQVLVPRSKAQGVAEIVNIPVVLSKHSNASIAARFTPGYAGTILGISASVTDPATTAAKLATFTPAVAGTPTTGGALNLTSANCTPVGAKVDGTAITAGAAFTAGQEITIVASAVTAFVEGQVVIYLKLAGNY